MCCTSTYQVYFSSQTCRTQEWRYILARTGAYLIHAWYPRSHSRRFFIFGIYEQRYCASGVGPWPCPSDHTRRKTQRTAVCTNNAVPVH